MPVTFDLVAAFVRCRYKAFLKCTGETGTVTDYELLERELAEAYRQKAIPQLAQRFSPNEIASSPLSLEAALADRHRLFLNVPCNSEQGSITFSAIESAASSTTRKPQCLPIVFCPNKKLSKDGKLTAAVTIAAISNWHSILVPCVKMIHGPDFSETRLILLGASGPTRLAKESAAVLHDLEALVAAPTPPSTYLNDHCGICEFRDRCRQDAVNRDDLSLLRGLHPKEIEAWKKRGIFTVTQLAYTFRAKTMGRSSQQPKRHSQPLQAMAIRDKKTYVRKRPEMPTSSVKVFFDVEGIPEREFFYLIGVVVVRNGTATSHEFWADDESQQEGMWQDFLGLLAELSDYVLVHFGRYERDFIREMQRRYGATDHDPAQRLFDVHVAIRTNVFFPVYSNGLKDIARFLGFEWQGPVRSGVDSIVCRCKWEKTNEERCREDLLRYNREDCQAVMSVFNHLAVLGHVPSGSPAEIAETDGLFDSTANSFSRKTFAIPVMETITKCAYFNYQQQKVFFRTDKNVRRSVRRRQQASRAALKENRIVECSPPENCPTCGRGPMNRYKHARQVKTVRDLKFFRGGVKRWIIRRSSDRYACRSCGHTCYSPEYPTRQPNFGHGVASWAVYQHMALQQSLEAVTASLNDVFGYTFSVGMVNKAHTFLARLHEVTESLLLARLRAGKMICADETKIKIKITFKGTTGYVWAFSGPEVVVYRFHESRDGTLLNDVLKGFTGVLVSDFYGVYDSVSCQQQKCLVHLTRDINDDLLKVPFDEELKELATRFTAVMTPIIESIDRYGLAKRHLGRFVREADRYRRWVAQQCFGSQVAQRYQHRIGKYGERLFTFLSHDGVPWNNNIAENAVKLVVSRRKLLDGLMSKDGIKVYLVFLSIYQTLRRKGGSFLRFLLSGKTDLFEFLGE